MTFSSPSWRSPNSLWKGHVFHHPEKVTSRIAGQFVFFPAPFSTRHLGPFRAQVFALAAEARFQRRELATEEGWFLDMSVHYVKNKWEPVFLQWPFLNGWFQVTRSRVFLWLGWWKKVTWKKLEDENFRWFLDHPGEMRGRKDPGKSLGDLTKGVIFGIPFS